MISNQKRIDSFLAVLAEAQAMAKSALHIPGMENRLKLLSDGFAIMAPYVADKDLLGFDQIWKSRADVRHKQLKIYPRFSEDFALHEFLQVGFGARYGSHIRLYNQVNLNMQAETIRYMAGVLVHELGHADVAQQKGTTMTDYVDSKMDWIAEEVQMRTFDYHFLLAVGGSDYRNIFEKKLYWIKKLQSRRNPEQKFSPFSTDNGVALNLIFGPPPPDKNSERDSLFELHCLLAAADGFPQPVANQIKYNLISNSYDKLYESL